MSSSFKWACFISYRHGQGELIKEFIDDLQLALENRLGLLGFGLGVFVDKDRLKPSYSVNPGLANAICRSVCMIVVFTNNYFDKNSPFCAKEFCAMIELEKERLRENSLPAELNLIIPILLRKPDNIPREILDRNPCNFSAMFTNPEEHYRIFKLKNELQQSSIEIAFPDDIEEIAAVIVELYQILTSQDGDMCERCDSFEFPGDDIVNAFLKKTAYKPRFPLGKPLS